MTSLDNTCICNTVYVYPRARNGYTLKLCTTSHTSWSEDLERGKKEEEEEKKKKKKKTILKSYHMNSLLLMPKGPSFPI